MRTLSKRDIKELNSKIGKEVFTKKAVVKEEKGIYFQDNVAKFFTLDESVLPTLKYLLIYLYLPKIVVDMGAVKFIVGGADIMRPGIIGYDSDIVAGDYVVVVDANYGKPLAVGKLLYDSNDLSSLKSGKVVQNIHYVGDELWNRGG